MTDAEPRENMPAKIPTDDTVTAGIREASEDRRIAALMVEPKNRAQLIQRAEVTESLVAEVDRLRAAVARVEAVACSFRETALYSADYAAVNAIEAALRGVQ